MPKEFHLHGLYPSHLFMDELLCETYINEGFLCPDDTLTLINPDWRLEDVVTSLGYFPSTTQARKNGWGGELPRYWVTYVMGKRLPIDIHLLPDDQRELYKRYYRRFGIEAMNRRWTMEK